MPTRDAAAYAVLTLLLLFVAVNLQAGWVYAVDALLIGFGLAGWLSAVLAVRPLPVRRALPAEVGEGDRVIVQLAVGPTRLPRFLLHLRDEVPGLDPGEVFLSLVRGPVSAAYETVARRRGIHRTRKIELRSVGLTGLFRASGRADCPGVITVLPRYAVLRRFPLPGRRGLELHPYLKPSRTGMEVAGVREFREGDDPSHIHWRSTARRGTLVVREFERDVEPGAVLVIDTRPAACGAEGFEALVRAAASVAHLIGRTGQPVRILTDGPDGPIAVGWTEALRFLAAVEQRGSRTPAELCATLPAGTPAVVFTGDAEAVTPLAARGHPLVAVLAGAPSGGLLLAALGVPVRLLREGEEVGTCLDS
ncbi:MAG: DUF58 domain-containing protein [Armatimonadota bacterium]|nr:DUF58 domain-containing protein [Armatimonadota bacterium]MDR7450401.1 DUF58 domain-containing protein [Armatimonadota bacterium]MDR7467016.1 DUF58 domain-containing protein [Armatimonadota bacterium]MDR7493442.1 DUF58 domain-containing protein [Armatimonadota bacterium]MDR7498707.1 DUF58 domain-containing protein [Armatimonadota bacterium]